MSWIDWIIAIVPLMGVIGVGLWAKRYVRGVSDYMAAGRICRRYVLTTALMAEAIGLVSLISYIEVRYMTGFALTYWNNLMLPLGMILTMSGYCYYRYRETKAMSIGQYLEMRYNRSLRVFASFLRSISEIVANSIMPALAARFFITFLDLPQSFEVFGFKIPSFAIIMLITLTFAVLLICVAGQLSLTITDTIQGLIFFPAMLIFMIFIWSKFSWSGEIMEVLSDRVAGESFLDPYDIKKLKDFNILMLLTTFIGMFLHRISGIGGEASAALNAHEAKMGAILGTWRGAFMSIFMVLIAISLITILHHKNFSSDAKEIRTNISRKAAEELVKNPKELAVLMEKVKAIPEHKHEKGIDKPYSRKNSPDEVYFKTAQAQFGMDGEGSSKTQQFKTLFRQLLLPATFRHMLPVGLTGLFCMLILLFILSTDDSRIFCASSTIVQDCVVPFYKNGQLTPEKHVLYLRILSIFVGIIFFLGSLFMSQLDFINLFVQITYGMWLGGCGPMLVFGLYSRFGTSAGAWSSLLSGMGLTAFGIFLQRGWATTIYPWLESNGYVVTVQNFLITISKPFYPYIDWTEMTRLKCPINSYEFYLCSMLLSLAVYIIVSKITYKEPFNLERMLHRGEYAIEGEEKKTFKFKENFNLKRFFTLFIGITPQHTRGDKIIVWSVFIYTFIYKFLLFFVGVAIWNKISPWPIEWWGTYFFIIFLLVPGISGLITVVWFTIGSSHDLVQMFRDLEQRTDNPLDNGMVEGDISLSDKELVEKVETPKEEKKQ